MESVLSIGNFDGLHIGHRGLLSYQMELAREQNLQTAVITYDNHPSQVLNKHFQPLVLMPAEVKKQQLLDIGINTVEMVHFDESLALTTADEFLHEFIIPRFNPRIIVVGYDSHFGFQRQGSYDFLKKHSSTYGFDVRYVEPVKCEGKVVSSSLIRELLSQGDIGQANTFLTRPYGLYGKVVSATGVGRGLGFPTANLQLTDPNQLIPHRGIYLSRVYLGSEEFFGLTNIGLSPTLKHSGLIEIETYILDFDRQINGTQLQVDLLRFMREENVFDTREALIAAIGKDLAQARELIRMGVF